VIIEVWLSDSEPAIIRRLSSAVKCKKGPLCGSVGKDFVYIMRVFVILCMMVYSPETVQLLPGECCEGLTTALEPNDIL